MVDLFGHHVRAATPDAERREEWDAIGGETFVHSSIFESSPDGVDIDQRWGDLVGNETLSRLATALGHYAEQVAADGAAADTSLVNEVAELATEIGVYVRAEDDQESSYVEIPQQAP